MSNYDFNEKTLYNGEHRHEGMNVVPFVIQDRTIAIELGAKPEFMETFHTPKGKKYLVSFTEVPEDQVESYMHGLYNSEIREYFDNYGNNSYKEQFSRCVINGKVCAKSNSCSKCKKVDSAGNPLKDSKKGLLSLDSMLEDGHEPSIESAVETDMLFEELLEAAAKLKAYYPKIIKDKCEGKENSEIISELPVSKSTAYKDFEAIEKFVHKFLDK